MPARRRTVAYSAAVISTVLIDVVEHVGISFYLYRKKANNMSTKKLNTGGDEKHHATPHKGQPSQNHQKGSPGVSRRDAGKHKKDESDGADKNTTKKQGNSI